jgi:Fur family peroxide stress response transcriptional regulator
LSLDIQHNVTKALKAVGLKATPQRWIVFKVLFEANNHPTAEEVFNKVCVEYPNISLATVYKCLEALVKAGVVNRIETKADSMRYDARQADHFHIIDMSTLSITDYDDEELNTLIDNYLKKANLLGKTFKGFSLNIYTN